MRSTAALYRAAGKLVCPRHGTAIPERRRRHPPPLKRPALTTREVWQRKPAFRKTEFFANVNYPATRSAHRRRTKMPAAPCKRTNLEGGRGDNSQHGFMYLTRTSGRRAASFFYSAFSLPSFPQGRGLDWPSTTTRLAQDRPAGVRHMRSLGPPSQLPCPAPAPAPPTPGLGPGAPAPQVSRRG